MGKLLLTIAIPTYNGGDSLLTAVKSCSCIELEYSDFEILVVDNCSDDGSIEKLEKLSGELKMPRIIKNSNNLGRIGNWNKCLELSRGDYILFLFNNDLISENNRLHEAIGLLENNKNCSLVNMPWVVSDFEMKEMTLPPQFYKRTPGYGCFDCKFHIKEVVESGKLPFVPLQSNVMRRNNIADGDIMFNCEIPIASDGVFLSQLAMETEEVGFIEKPSVIWRYNAPGRLHSNINLIEHTKQVIESFIIINNFTKTKINISKAASNHKSLEYFLTSIIQAQSFNDLTQSRKLLISWWKTIRKHNINIVQFIFRMLFRIIKLPLKFQTFRKLFVTIL